MNMNNKEKITDQYNKIATWFDQARNKDLFEKEYLDLIISFVSSGSVLDLGCGTGEPLAKFFIEKDYKLVGIDGSQKMIDLCNLRFKHFSNAQFFVADMRNLRLEEQFDIIIAWDSFFHLEADDQRLMFKIFKSHIKAGGILAFTSGAEAGEVWGDNGGENLYHASLSASEYKKLLKENNFELIKHEIEDPKCGGHTIWVARNCLKSR